LLPRHLRQLRLLQRLVTKLLLPRIRKRTWDCASHVAILKMVVHANVKAVSTECRLHHVAIDAPKLLPAMQLKILRPPEKVILRHLVLLPPKAMRARAESHQVQDKRLHESVWRFIQSIEV